MSELLIDELQVKYGQVLAVKGVSIAVADGEFVTLLGPSGCGKTTTLRAVAGLERCSSGSVVIGGRTVAGPRVHVPPERRGVNMVFQSYAVWPHMTVFDNVAFGVRHRRVPRSEVRRRVSAALDLVGLGALASRFATELSGGQQQRVALARAVVTEPDVLLFDEPLSNLDASLREQMRYEIRELHDRIGKTAVYVTHDQSEAMVMSDRVVLMNEGVIEQVGSPRDLYEYPRSRFAAEFLGVSNLWPGVVVDSFNGGEGSVEIQGNEDMPKWSVTVGGLGFGTVGSTGTLGVRSQRVATFRGGEKGTADPNCWSGLVQTVEYLGPRVESRILLSNGYSIHAETDPVMRLAVGEEVFVRVKPAEFVWMPDEAGESSDESELRIAEHSA